MNTYISRTDLALEAQEIMEPTHEHMHGIVVTESHNDKNDTHITRVEITTKNGAKAIGKPMGTYITIEAPAMDSSDEGYHRAISIEIANQLKEMIPSFEKEHSILVVGLGNRDVTADSLGPHVIDNLYITRHIAKEYGKENCVYAKGSAPLHILSSIAPGVMAQTGMETAEIIKGVVSETKPDLMIAIDALAARSIRRLNRTIQISDTGIQPGSGVGNHRNALTQESLGIPVIAIGVPVVVDAATIVKDAVGPCKIMAELNNMYVTCKDIDTTIKRLSFTISEALNIAVY